jgi:hypothetical protein
MTDPNILSSPYPPELRATDPVIALQARAFERAVDLNLQPVDARTLNAIAHANKSQQTALDAASLANYELVSRAVERITE